MKKHIIYGALVLIIVVIGIVFVSRSHSKTPAEQSQTATSTKATSTPVSTAPINNANQAVENQAWGVFEAYLTAAKNHDLTTLTYLSYQLSATCKDPNQQTACYQKMDTVYLAGKDLKESDLPIVVYDNKQIILESDWQSIENPSVTIVGRSLIYFTRTSAGTPQVLSFDPGFAEDINHQDSNGKTLTTAQISAEVASTTSAFDQNIKKDSDGNGWWDIIQALFYTN